MIKIGLVLLLCNLCLVCFVDESFAQSVSCDYTKGYTVCNGMRVKKSCRKKNINPLNIIMMGTGYIYLNDVARAEYNEGIKCLEYDYDEDKKLLIKEAK